MMADIFEAEIYVSESHHSAAWGAAWTALVGIGKVNSFEDIKKNIPMGECQSYQIKKTVKYIK